MQQRDPVGRVGGDQLQFYPKRFCQRLGEIDVIAHQLVSFGVDRAKRRVGVEGGDFHHAGGFNIRQLVCLNLCGQRQNTQRQRDFRFCNAHDYFP